MEITALLLSRLQFAFTVSFHIIFPSFTIGLAAWLTVLEALYLASGQRAYRVVFEFWLKIFGVAFGMGVVSGIVMAFHRMILRLGFMDMYRVLGPILDSWPYPDFESIAAINEIRNSAAHGGETAKVLYKGCNPFRDPDASAHICFDVWAIKQSIPEFFWRTIERPKDQLRRYYVKFGEI